MSEETLTVDALVEANDILQHEVTNLRRSNKICRTVIRALRASVTSMQAQLDLAKWNDDMFKRFCSGEFDAPGQFDAVVEVPSTEGGLPAVEGQAEASV